MSDEGPLSTLSQHQELAEHLKIARSYTHCVLTKSDIGTAVALRLGGRLFLVTAGHIITGAFEVGLFSGEGPGRRAEVLNRHYHPDSPRTDVYADIGFIEIKDVPSLTACQIEQLHIGEATPRMPEHDVLLWVAGCPASAHEIRGDIRQVGMSVVGAWLRGGDEAALALEYVPEGYAVHPDGGIPRPAPSPPPAGFSGGGVWFLRQTAEAELFQPLKHVRMCGTQFQWSVATRTLRAMRPRFTVPYFFECYPELRPEYGHVLDTMPK
jgi:hypothetical protein